MNQIFKQIGVKSVIYGNSAQFTSIPSFDSQYTSILGRINPHPDGLYIGLAIELKLSTRLELVINIDLSTVHVIMQILN